MDAQATAPFLRHFAGLPDPRRHNVRHVFGDILTIAVLAVLCRSDDWADVVLWARVQHEWLATFLALPNGIPSADTFRRVFARVDPDAFERCFTAWTAALAEASGGRLISVDGKTLRRSFARAWERLGAAHLVSAWCGDDQVVLGQLAVADKSNEITAIPRLLDLLNVKGAIVTIDAMGCQTDIAATIVGKGGDYLLAVKDNQPTLAAGVAALMDEAVLDRAKGVEGAAEHVGYFEEASGGHGRVETRRVWVSDRVGGLGEGLAGRWARLACVALAESTRRDLGDPTGKVSVERRYYISSLPHAAAHAHAHARTVAGAIRGHWGVENNLHWRLGVSFGEDQSRLRVGHGAENFSRLRRVALNKLRPVEGERRQSLKGKRYRCSLSREYLLEVLLRD
jgi:predicted transposase YbfD/YdcC